MLDISMLRLALMLGYLLICLRQAKSLYEAHVLTRIFAGEELPGVSSVIACYLLAVIWPLWWTIAAIRGIWSVARYGRMPQ